MSAGPGPGLPLGVHRTRAPEETEDLAARLARSLRPGDRVALRGVLGSGKTTFVRGLARGLGLDPAAVHSPTYTRVHRYRGALTLVHVDLYRVESPEAYDEMGLEDEEEAAASIVVFEWSERLPAGAPQPQVWVDLEISGESSRRIRVSEAPAGAEEGASALRAPPRGSAPRPGRPRTRRRPR